MLGLYGELYSRSKHAQKNGDTPDPVFAEILQNKAEIFPSEFEMVTDEGTTTMSLFGKLIDEMEKFLDCDEAEVHAMVGAAQGPM